MTEPGREPPGPIAESDDPDYEINPTDASGGATFESPSDQGRRRAATWIGVILVAVVALVAVWAWVGRRPTSEPPPQVRSEQPAQPQEAPAPLGAPALDREIPPLADSDVVVRELVRQLTSHPAVAAWLATDGLLRNFTVSVANIADGMSPARHLTGLRPATPFAVTAQGEALVIDPASYRRYDTFASAAASVSAEGTARLYGTLKPRLTEAYRELGEPGGDIDRAIERAIVQLLRTPVIDGPIQVAVAPRGIGYVYADERLEALTPPQKQLLRMGPANVRTIQRALRDIALALGIPAGRLPPPGNPA